MNVVILRNKMGELGCLFQKEKISKLAEVWWKPCGMKTICVTLQYQVKTHTRKTE